MNCPKDLDLLRGGLGPSPARLSPSCFPSAVAGRGSWQRLRPGLLFTTALSTTSVPPVSCLGKLRHREGADSQASVLCHTPLAHNLVHFRVKETPPSHRPGAARPQPSLPHLAPLPPFSTGFWKRHSFLLPGTSAGPVPGCPQPLHPLLLLDSPRPCHLSCPVPSTKNVKTATGLLVSSSPSPRGRLLGAAPGPSAPFGARCPPQ